VGRPRRRRAPLPMVAPACVAADIVPASGAISSAAPSDVIPDETRSCLPPGAHPWRGCWPPCLPPNCGVARRRRNWRSPLLHWRPHELLYRRLRGGSDGVGGDLTKRWRGVGMKREEKLTTTYVCHVVTGHGFRPVWTCSETRTAIRDLSDTHCEFMDRDDTAA
jgi:hypothetical protein